MRYFGEARFRFSGDVAAAKLYAGLARTLLGQVLHIDKTLGGLFQTARKFILPNGAVIRVQSIGTLPPAIDIFFPVVGAIEYDEATRERPWIPSGIVLVPASDDAPKGWGFPFYSFPERDPINAPFGTPNGRVPQILLTPYRNNRYTRQLEDDPVTERTGVDEEETEMWFLHRPQETPYAGTRRGVWDRTNALRVSLELKTFLFPIRDFVDPSRMITIEVSRSGMMYHSAEGVYRPGYETVLARVMRVGAVYRAGENIAFASLASVEALSNDEVAELFYTAWFNSPPHYANMVGFNDPRDSEDRTVLAIGGRQTAGITEYGYTYPDAIGTFPSPVQSVVMSQVMTSLERWVYGFPINWVGDYAGKEVCLSWTGTRMRYGGIDISTCREIVSVCGRGVFAPGRVIGACVRDVTEGETAVPYVYVCCMGWDNRFTSVGYAAYGSADGQLRVYRTPFQYPQWRITLSTTSMPDWELVGEFDLNEECGVPNIGYAETSYALFSRSGALGCLFFWVTAKQAGARRLDLYNWGVDHAYEYDRFAGDTTTSHLYARYATIPIEFDLYISDDGVVSVEAHPARPIMITSSTGADAGVGHYESDGAGEMPVLADFIGEEKVYGVFRHEHYLRVEVDYTSPLGPRDCANANSARHWQKDELIFGEQSIVLYQTDMALSGGVVEEDDEKWYEYAMDFHPSLQRTLYHLDLRYGDSATVVTEVVYATHFNAWFPSTVFNGTATARMEINGEVSREFGAQEFSNRDFAPIVHQATPMNALGNVAFRQLHGAAAEGFRTGVHAPVFGHASQGSVLWTAYALVACCGEYALSVSVSPPTNRYLYEDVFQVGDSPTTPLIASRFPSAVQFVADIETFEFTDLPLVEYVSIPNGAQLDFLFCRYGDTYVIHDAAVRFVDFPEVPEGERFVVRSNSAGIMALLGGYPGGRFRLHQLARV